MKTFQKKLFMHKILSKMILRPIRIEGNSNRRKIIEEADDINR